MRRGDRWDELFTLLFMLLAIAAGILYFAVKGNRLPFIVCGGVAVVLRLTQYFLRMVGR